MKNLSIAFILLLISSGVNAATINIFKTVPKPAPVVVLPVIIPPVTPIVLPLSLPAPLETIVNNDPSAELKTVIPQQSFLFFDERDFKEAVNCEEPPKGGDNVSAVPVPASLPLMATALGIFGITRRRKTFK